MLRTKLKIRFSNCQLIFLIHLAPQSGISSLYGGNKWRHLLESTLIRWRASLLFVRLAHNAKFSSVRTSVMIRIGCISRPGYVRKKILGDFHCTTHSRVHNGQKIPINKTGWALGSYARDSWQGCNFYGRLGRSRKTKESQGLIGALGKTTRED